MVFISWSPFSGRSEELSHRLGCKLFLIHYLKFKVPIYAPLKYFFQAIKTATILFAERPRIVFVETPPVFAVSTVYLYCIVTGARFIIDSHSGTFVSWKWKWLLFLHRFLSRRAILTIVTNQALAQIISEWRARSFVLPVTLPTYGNVEMNRSRDENAIFVINSFSDDEPLAPILSAATKLPSVKFRISGDVSRCPRWAKHAKPDNVCFTGFLPKREYVQEILNSTAVLALTTRENTLLLGAYEAVSLERPMIISGSAVLRSTFNLGCVYVKNESGDIARGIGQMLESVAELTLGIKQLKTCIGRSLDSQIDHVKHLVAESQ